MSLLSPSCMLLLSSRRTVDGREIRPLKEEQLVEQCNLIKEKGLKNVGAHRDGCTNLR